MSHVTRHIRGSTFTGIASSAAGGVSSVTRADGARYVGVSLLRVVASPAISRAVSLAICGQVTVLTGVVSVEGIQYVNVHAVGEILARIQYGDGVAGGAEGVGDGVPAEANKVHAYPMVDGGLHTGDHVCIAGDQHNVTDQSANGA